MTLKNLGGCDSLVIQRFKLSAADTIRRDSTISAALPSGATSITRAFKNRFGCDSIEIISLKILRCDTTILAPLMRCDARDTLTQIKRFPNAYGCDSIVIQPFILALKDSTVINLTSCNERDTGTTATILSNRYGCDSIIIRRTKWVASGIITQLNLEKSLTCFGDSTGGIVFKSLGGGKPPYQITWNTGSSNERIQGLVAGKYIVSVTDARGCTVRDSLVIAAPSPLSINTQIKSPRCFEEANGSITITEINGGSTPYRFQYAGKNIALERLPYSVTNLTAQRYNFSVTDSKGCKAIEAINLPQPQQLAIYFNENSLLLKLGDSVQLSPQLNFTPRSLKWTPNLYLNCDTCLRPKVLPKATTNYKIEAFNENGCSIAESINIKLSKERNVFAPNSFSPNEDSENDRFTIFTDGTVERIKVLEIYNRWGGKIFENKNFLSNHENEGWDGTFNGKNAEAGVYIYYFIVIFKDGKEMMFKGEVSLIR